MTMASDLPQMILPNAVERLVAAIFDLREAQDYEQREEAETQLCKLALVTRDLAASSAAVTRAEHVAVDLPPASEPGMTANQRQRIRANQASAQRRTAVAEFRREVAAAGEPSTRGEHVTTRRDRQATIMARLLLDDFASDMASIRCGTLVRGLCYVGDTWVDQLLATEGLPHRKLVRELTHGERLALCERIQRLAVAEGTEARMAATREPLVVDTRAETTLPHATLITGGFHSTCNACAKAANPLQFEHECGVIWTHITTRYADEATIRRVQCVRPDLKFIPLGHAS